MIRYALPIAMILLADCPTSEEHVADVFTQARLFHDEGDLDKAIAATPGPSHLIQPAWRHIMSGAVFIR